jgi:hypothetical protein
MKKLLLIPMLILFLGVSFTMTANAQSCGDLVWTADRLSQNPDIAANCLDVVERSDGNMYAKFRARVMRQGASSTVIRYQRPDGTWSPSERVFPPQGCSDPRSVSQPGSECLCCRQEQLVDS